MSAIHSVKHLPANVQPISAITPVGVSHPKALPLPAMSTGAATPIHQGGQQTQPQANPLASSGPRKGGMGQGVLGWRHLNIKRLRSLYTSLQDNKEESLESNADELIEKLRRNVVSNEQGFSDETFDQKHQDAALQYILVREAIERMATLPESSDPQENANVQAALLSKARHMFEQQSLPVLSGLNTAEAIAETVANSPGVIDKSALRNLYRSQLIESPGPGGFVLHLLRSHSPENLLKVLAGLMNAASDDLNSAVSSSPIKVTQCLENLRICKLIHQIFIEFEKQLFRIVECYAYKAAKVLNPAANEWVPKGFKVNASHYDQVFSKPWQEVATDFIKMLGNVPTRSQLEDKVNRQHLHDQCEPSLGVYLKSMYAQYLKTMFEKLPEEAFLRHCNPDFLMFKADKTPQERLDRMTWIDYCADLYDGRNVNTHKCLKC